MALSGNTLLLTYFIGRRESSAVLIQALGVGSNFVLLAQVRGDAGRKSVCQLRSADKMCCAADCAMQTWEAARLLQSMHVRAHA